MNTTRVLIMGLAALPCLVAEAQDRSPAARTAAYQNSVSQEQLKAASRRLKTEMSVLLEEFSNCKGAATELARLKEAIASLDTVTEKDMTEVVNALLAASRADQAGARAELTKAGGRQKDIQSELRALADKLSRQADEVAMQKRLEELAVRQVSNLRATKNLAARAPHPGEQEGDLRTEQAMWRAEQFALEKEIHLAVEALANGVKAAPQESGKLLSEVLQTAHDGKIEEASKEATLKLDTAMPESIARQEQIAGKLKEMISRLAGSRTEEEQNRELAAALSELAQKEQALAAATPRLNEGNQLQAQKGQQEVASRLEMLQDRIQQLNPEAGAKAAEANPKSQELADKLKSPALPKDPTSLAATSEGQKELSKQLGEASDILQKQADELAGNSPDMASPPMTAQEAAIQDAMNNLEEARANNDLARKQNQEKQDFQERLAAARQRIEAAAQKASEAGASISEAVQPFLTEAEKHAAIAATGKQAEHNLYHVNANVNKAMTALQEAANELATADMQGQDQPGEGQPGAAGAGQNGGGAGNGRFFMAGSSAGEAQRDALSLLKQEKSAPGYETMVNQYIKNLADDRKAPEP